MYAGVQAKGPQAQIRANKNTCHHWLVIWSLGQYLCHSVSDSDIYCLHLFLIEVLAGIAF
jgi:hypothetical protein